MLMLSAIFIWLCVLGSRRWDACPEGWYQQSPSL